MGTAFPKAGLTGRSRRPAPPPRPSVGRLMSSAAYDPPLPKARRRTMTLIMPSAYKGLPARLSFRSSEKKGSPASLAIALNDWNSRNQRHC